jgi:hypothetical protein
MGRYPEAMKAAKRAPSGGNAPGRINDERKRDLSSSYSYRRLCGVRTRRVWTLSGAAERTHDLMLSETISEIRRDCASKNTDRATNSLM